MRAQPFHGHFSLFALVLHSRSFVCFPEFFLSLSIFGLRTVPLSNISTMPSESSLKKHADIAREALQTFHTVISLNSASLIKTAIADLIDVIAHFHTFTPFFNHHPLFQELPVAAFTAIDDFRTKNPKFDLPQTFHKVVALNSKIQDILSSPFGKKDITPSGPRADRTKKIKPPATLTVKPSSAKLGTESPESAPFGDEVSALPMDTKPDHSPIHTAAVIPNSASHASSPSVKPSLGPILGSHERVACDMCSPHDIVSIKRTREIVTDPLVSALVKEDNQAYLAFNDGVRHEIVVNCERLRVHLSLIDRLMSIYNLSVANAKANGKAPF